MENKDENVTLQADRWHELTDGQKEAVTLAASGMSDAEIAERFASSESTVRGQLQTARLLLGLRGKSPRALIAYYYTLGPGRQGAVA